MRAVAGILGLAVAVGPGAAQERAAPPGEGDLVNVLAIVVDEVEREPLQGVLVVMDTGHRQLSDELGRVFLVGVAAGERQITLVTPTCRIEAASFEVSPGVQQYRFSVIADPILGEEAPSPASHAKRVTSEDIEDMRARSFVDILERVAPEMVASRGGQIGTSGRIVGRTRSSPQGLNTPVIVMDGTPMGPGAMQLLRTIRPTDIAYVDIDKGATGGWSYGTGGSGGVISIVTKKGGLAAEAGHKAELCPNVKDLFPPG